MNIYSCVDSKNIEKIIVLFYSVYVNYQNDKKDDLYFYLLTDNDNFDILIPEDIKLRLEIKVIKFENKWLRLLEDFNLNFYKLSSWCKNDMNFARFFIFEIFDNIDRAIYLDWDMLVIGNLYELLDEYNDNQYIYYSKLENKQTIFNSVFKKEFKYNNSLNCLIAHSKKQKIKLHPVSKVMNTLNINNDEMFKSNGFNAGFYIVSREHFNENLLFELINKLINIQKKFNCFIFGTQVVINLLLICKKKSVPNIWNKLPFESNKNTKIIHWNGIDKPWKDKNELINKIWWEYYNKIYKFKNR